LNHLSELPVNNIETVHRTITVPGKTGGQWRTNGIERTRSASAVSLPHSQLLEPFLNKDQKCRRVAIRYDKLAANYLAFGRLASIRFERANKSAP
jgi:transposase